MRRTLGLAAICLVSTVLFAGCSSTTNLNAPTPSPSPVVPNVSGEVVVPSAASAPTTITRGSDGNLWFTERALNKVAKVVIGSSVTITEPLQLSAASSPTSITNGPDTNLWVAETGSDKIAKVSPSSGALLAEFALAPGANPQQIISGPNGSLWFTEAGRGGTPNRIGAITVAGVLSEFNIPTANAGLSSIAVGADGALWFTESTVSKIGRITAGGAVTAEMPTQTPAAGPFQIALGPDGAMWFTESAVDRLGRVATSGAPTDIALPGTQSVTGFTIGNDNNFYIADPTANSIAQVNTAATLTVKEFKVPTAGAFSVATSFPGMFVVGYDGKIYFTESGPNKIGQFTYF
ncbi:MAG: Virginiamycin B lyase [Candidatus Eremiobacteraeota bacterium]|nr:Virginiamycin B lyase [Candidatus Eremiobacteraeota bacterium]